MTKKDFILLARVMKNSKPMLNNPASQDAKLDHQVATNQWEHTLRELAKELSLDNNAFNFDTFYKACGLEPFNLKSSGK